MTIGLHIGITQLRIMGSAVPAPVPSEVIQWLKGGATGATLGKVSDIKDPLVADLAEYAGLNHYTLFDGNGDRADWSGVLAKDVDMEEGIHFFLDNRATQIAGILEGTLSSGAHFHMEVDSSYGTPAAVTIQIYSSAGTSGPSNLIAVQPATAGWNKVSITSVSGLVTLEVGGVSSTANTTALDGMALVNLRLGYGDQFTPSFSNVAISGLTLGKYIVRCTDVASGELSFIDSTGVDIADTIDITSTSGTSVMQQADADAPALGPKFGGNLFLTDGLTYLDLIPTQGQNKVVTTTITLHGLSFDTTNGGYLFFASLTNVDSTITRRAGMFMGQLAVGSAGLHGPIIDYRGTGYHKVQVMLRNYGNETPDSSNLHKITVDDVVVYEQLDLDTVYPINKDVFFTLFGTYTSTSSLWLAPIGAKAECHVYNDTDSTLVCDHKYTALASGVWRNDATKVEYTPNSGPATSYALPLDPADTSLCINGLVAENQAAYLNELGATAKQTDPRFNVGLIGLDSKDGITLDELDLERCRRHVGYYGTQNYNGAFGAWILLDSDGNVADREQVALANKRTLAQWDAYEITYGCVGDSGAQRVGGAYVLDVDGFVVPKTYVIT